MTLEYSRTVLKELDAALGTVKDEKAEELADMILNAGTVFVSGAGRSGLMAKAFAMRVGHLGIPAAVVGETITPSFRQGDLLVICSGSGETRGQKIIAEKAKSLRGKLALLTIEPLSSIGVISDCVIEIAAPSPKASENEGNSVQPMASLFEQSQLLVLDIVILKLMSKLKMDANEMFQRHVNLE